MPPPPRLPGAAPRGSALVLAAVVGAVVALATLDAAGAVPTGATDPAAVVALGALTLDGAVVPATLGLAALVVAAGAVVGFAVVGVFAVLDPPQAASSGKTKSTATPTRDARMRTDIKMLLTPQPFPIHRARRSVSSPQTG